MLATSDMSGNRTPSLQLECSDCTRITFAPDAISMNCFSQAAAAKSQPAVRPLPEKNCCADTNTSGCSHRTEQKTDSTRTAGNIVVCCAVVLSLTCTVKPQRTTAEFDVLLMLLHVFVLVGRIPSVVI